MLRQSVNNGKDVLPLPPQHIWASDPRTSAIRRTLLLRWAIISISVWIVCFLVYLIFYGASRYPERLTKHLHVILVDFDQEQAGTVFLQAFKGNPALGWIYRSPAYYQNDPDRLIHEVNDGNVWAAVYIKAGTTQLINSTINSIFTTTYESTVPLNPTITFIYDEGRSISVPFYIIQPITNALMGISARYSAILLNQLNQRLLSSSNGSIVLSINSVLIGPALSNPLRYTVLNIHPAFSYAGTIGTTLGYLFLWVIAVAHVGLTIGITSPLIGKFKIIDIILFRLFYGLFQGLIFAIIFSLCVLWFTGAPLHGIFVRYWLFNWLAIMTAIAINGTVTISFGDFAEFVLLIFLVLNLATGANIIPLELSSRFYRIGYGLPLYQCMSAGKHFVFGSFTHLSLNVGVLLAWYFGILGFILVITYYRGKKQEQKLLEKQRNGEESEEKENVD
ncbi:unnamed protein product [Didymodactylos carnosus]|uniref:DUF3533 domain-containing protein n=1 Tax=Didymodactylos carnosus TaxID=1234261 RepID=A0A815DQC7_9BILA|nr:unnamed protein product [Didymodactylos carnosus]CAF1299978.1 unnamed protein product [Didymodactylos carnosus]CAF3890187.1 unnamed protein product [Didymodactylos carnosus]CAF4121873.1 unnamed protein product [Didymodactylos carnosus]